MGLQIHVKLKDGANTKKINTFLRKNNLNEFQTEQYNAQWLKDINTDPKSPQAHLKPADRDLTMDELKRIFGYWAEENLLEFDIGYSRTSQEQMNGYCSMIHDNADMIEYITHVPDIIERYIAGFDNDVSPDVVPILEKLYKAPQEPEKLPDNEQNHPNLEGGLFLCKSFSIKPFWVIFGKVDRPKFLKEKIYKEDIYNNIYHDKNGYAYLMFPLLALNGKEMDAVVESYKYAWGMGLREAFTLLIPLVYHLSVTDFGNVADDYIYAYNQPNELEDKFDQVFKHITSTYVFSDTAHTGFHYSDFHKQFRVNTKNSVLDAKIGVLTALLKAIANKHGQNAAKELLQKYNS